MFYIFLSQLINNQLLSLFGQLYDQTDEILLKGKVTVGLSPVLCSVVT